MFKLNYLKQEEQSAEGAVNPTAAPVQAEHTPTKVEPVEAVVEPTVTPELTETPNEDTSATQEPTTPETPEPEGTKTNLEQVRDLVQDAGLDVKEVATILNENKGDLTVDVLLKLKEKYGDSVASLIKDQLKATYNTQVEATKAKDKEVFDQVKEAFKDITEQSGEETWKELSTWAKTNVSNDNRKELNALLKQGGLAAKLAVQELTTAFKEAGTDTQDAELIEADNVSDGTVGTLDKASYDRELRALLDAGHDYDSSVEVQKLNNRRMKAINRGM